MDDTNDNDLPPAPAARPWYADEDDAIYPHAVALVRHHRCASTSWLQRQLRVGYSRATRLIGRMEEEGIIVGPR